MSEDGPPDIPMALWPHMVIADGAAEVLASLAQTFTLCVATNAKVSKRADIDLAMDRAGLGMYFSKVFCFTDIGAMKNTARFWDVVTSTLEARPAEIAMIGDSLEQDVLGPRQYGVHTIWFNPTGKALPSGVNVPSIRRLAELEGFLQNVA